MAARFIVLLEVGIALLGPAAHGETPPNEYRNESELRLLAKVLDKKETEILRDIDTNEARRMEHNDPKNKPNERDAKAVARYNEAAKVGREEREHLDKDLAEVRKRKAAVTAELLEISVPTREKDRKKSDREGRRVHLNWASESSPPGAIKEAVARVINGDAWPVGVKHAFATIKFEWKVQPVSSLELLNKNLSPPAAAYDPAKGTLVITRTFGQLAALDQRDVIAFELGKLVYDRLPARDRSRFDDQWANLVARDADPVRIANGELDRYAIFARAYRHFLFDRSQLPDALINWWDHDPPHAILTTRRTD